MCPWVPITMQPARVDRALARMAATGAPEQWVTDPATLRSYPRAGFAELAKARARGEEIVVLDVRRASERPAGHLDGSVHIPLHQLRHRLREIPDGTVWVYCASGLRAAIAASQLDAVGRQVVTVDDDFTAAHDIAHDIGVVTG